MLHGTIDIYILLTDVVMPEMNGKELSDAIKAIKPKIQTIFMSGYTDNIMLRRGILKENMTFINKPFTIETLANKTPEVLKNSTI